VFEIQIRGESGEWFRVDYPYKYDYVAIADADRLAVQYGAHGNIRVVPVGAR
jgi:hypothetical protein